MKQNEELRIDAPKIENTCKKCLYGVIINPYLLKCGKFKDGKPYDIYWEGKQCPFMKEHKKGE